MCERVVTRCNKSCRMQAPAVANDLPGPGQIENFQRACDVTPINVAANEEPSEGI